MTFDISKTLFPDAGLEISFRTNVDTIHNFLISNGMPEQTFIGRYTMPDAAGASISGGFQSSGTVGSTYAMVFDNNTATALSVSFLLTNPIVFVYDRGNNNSARQYGNYKTNFQNSSGDPQNWQHFGSADGLVWTMYDSRTAYTAAASGIVEFTPQVVIPPTVRYMKTVITTFRGLTSNGTINLAEWQWFDNAATPVMMPLPTARWNPHLVTTSGAFASQNMIQGKRIYRLSDALQTMAGAVGLPCFLHLEYGWGTVDTGGARFSLWYQLSSSIDAAGGATGNLTTRHQLPCLANNVNTPYLCMASGDTNRFGMALFHVDPTTGATDSTLIIKIERSKDSETCLDTDEFVQMNITNGTIFREFRLAKTGGSSVINEWSMALPIDFTGQRPRIDGTGTDIGQWYIRPNLGTEKAPLADMLGWVSPALTARILYPVRVYRGKTGERVINYYPLSLPNIGRPIRDAAGAPQVYTSGRCSLRCE